MKRVAVWLSPWVILLLPVFCLAQPILVGNAGFESNPIGAGTFQVLIPANWSVYDPTGIVNQNNNAVGVIRPNLGQDFFPGGVPEGFQGALVFLAGNQPGEAGLQQVLAATLQANTRYMLSVQIGNIASGTSLPGSADGGNVFYNLNGFPGYRIDLMAGTTVLASDNNSLAALIPEGEFRLSSFQFSTGAAHPNIGQNLAIRLVNLHLPGTPAAPNIEVDFDQVSLTATSVPEPGTLVLAGISLLGLGCLTSRRFPARSSSFDSSIEELTFDE